MFKTDVYNCRYPSDVDGPVLVGFRFLVRNGVLPSPARQQRHAQDPAEDRTSRHRILLVEIFWNRTQGTGLGTDDSHQPHHICIDCRLSLVRGCNLVICNEGYAIWETPR